MPYFRTFPEEFQSKAINRVLKAVKSGDNLQIVGLKGSGKSSIFRAIASHKSILNQSKVFYFDISLLSEISSKEILKMIETGLLTVQNNEHAIFLFDSFENITESRSEVVYKVLHSIYSLNRDFLTIIFSVIRPIELPDILFGKVWMVEPFSGDDLEWFWRGVEKAHEAKIDKKTKELILNVSGGYVAVIKRLMEAAIEGDDVEAIVANPSLNPHLLYQLELMKEGLLGQKNYFEVPIYDTFLRLKEEKNDFIEDIGGKRIKSKLTALEFKVLKKLFQNKNSLVLRDEMVISVWGENAGGIAEHALDQIVYRLGKKLKKSDLKIETIRGRGHVLKVI